MKHVLLFAIIIASVFTSCSKKSSVPINPTASVYYFYIAERDQDSIVPSHTAIYTIRTTSNVVTAVNQTMLSDSCNQTTHGVGNGCPGLPVIFTNVSFSLTNNIVTASWTGQAEINVMRYEIYKSTDGLNFKMAAWTAPLGSGANYAVAINLSK